MVFRVMCVCVCVCGIIGVCFCALIIAHLVVLNPRSASHELADVYSPPKGGVPAVNVRLGGLPNVLNGFIQAQ